MVLEIGDGLLCGIFAGEKVPCLVIESAILIFRRQQRVLFVFFQKGLHFLHSAINQQAGTDRC